MGREAGDKVREGARARNRNRDPESDWVSQEVL